MEIKKDFWLFAVLLPGKFGDFRKWEFSSFSSVYK